jgi:hypothetical protein
LTAHLNTGRKKRGLLGPDTTVFLRSELLSVDYYFNRGRVARKIKHNGVPLEKFPDSDCATACPATISVVGFLEDILEEEFPNFEVEEYFKRMPSFW